MATQTYDAVTPKQLHQRIEAGEPVELIDVRTPVEFREMHAAGARNVPLDELDAETIRAECNLSHDRPLYVICRTGNRADKACQALVDAGCEHVVNVAGGTVAWEQADLPVVRGRKSVSLERQVRIAAGSLVVLGVALGYLLHPAFFALSGFVGAGLVFAGVTDTCGMGMLIAKMPWNRVKSDSSPEGTGDAKADGCCSGDA